MALKQKHRFKNKVLLFVFKWFAPAIFRLWGKTLRLTIIGMNKADQIEKQEGNVLYTCWHGRLFLSATAYKDRGIYILVSPSLDGDYATTFIDRLGFPSTRGDKRYGGSQALKNVMEVVRQGNSIGFMIDGPLGPAYICNPGVVVTASRTQKVIIPTANNAYKKWYLKTWDRFIVPKPFTRCVYLVGDPIKVPENATKEQIDYYTALLQSKTDELERQADQILNIEGDYDQLITQRTDKQIQFDH